MNRLRALQKIWPKFLPKSLQQRREIAVLALLSDVSKSPASTYVPEVLKMGQKADFIVGRTLDEIKRHPKFDQINAIVWVSPAQSSLLDDVWRSANNKNIKWVHSAFSGLNPIHPFILENLVPRPDVVVTNGKGTSSRALAEYIICAALHFEKQIPRILRNSQNRLWDRFTMGELHGKTMGFVGFGDIARAAARIAKHAFGMRIVAMRRHRGCDEEGLADECYCSETPDERLQVFRQSDYVVCSLPGTPATQHLVGAAELAAMRPAAVFISVGRGTAVDEPALAAALAAGRLAAAALDVFEAEPLPAASPLWAADRVLVTPHNAFQSPAAGAAARRALEANLDRFEAWLAAGAPPAGPAMATPVDKVLGY